MDLDDDEEDEEGSQAPVTDAMTDALGSFYASLGMDEGGSGAGTPATRSPSPPAASHRLAPQAASAAGADLADDGSNSPGPAASEEDRERRKKKVGRLIIIINSSPKNGNPCWFFSPHRRRCPESP